MNKDIINIQYKMYVYSIDKHGGLDIWIKK